MSMAALFVLLAAYQFSVISFVLERFGVLGTGLVFVVALVVLVGIPVSIFFGLKKSLLNQMKLVDFLPLTINLIVFHIVGATLLMGLGVQNQSAFLWETKGYLYSTDQFLQGVSFDLLEGMRIDLYDILSVLTPYDYAPPVIEKGSPLAIFDALYRSFITGIFATAITQKLVMMFGRYKA